MALFARLDLKARVRRCFAHRGDARIFAPATVFLLLVVHVLLGFRRLRSLDCYRGDPLVERILGVDHLPDVATVSRCLKVSDDASVDRVRELVRSGVLNRLSEERFNTITLDFDGSVQSTKGHIEGTAVGFNKVKKGARSYYPLFCTIPQVGQFLDMLHRRGNIHDSNGAPTFMLACCRRVRAILPKARMEARADSAFFSDDVVTTLHKQAVEFSLSVPFQRFAKLKQMVEGRHRWRTLDERWSYFERSWKPDVWDDTYRFVFLRQRVKKQRKGPLQLDLFEPKDYDYDYKVIVTNKTCPVRALLEFHNGRGSQEKIFGEGKQHAALGVILARRRNANRLFTLAGMLAHNLTREMQMITTRPQRATLPRRPARWQFLSLGTIRDKIIRRPARITRPQNRLKLTIAAESSVRNDIEQHVEALVEAA